MFDKCYAGFLKIKMFNMKCREDKYKIRFLTLTTNPTSVDGLSDKEILELIQRNFETLKVRYERDFSIYSNTKTNMDMKGLDFEYELVHGKVIYKDRGRCIEKVRLGEYFSVRTLEGYGVVHILYQGGFIPHGWLVENWNEIHGSHIVDIREPKGSVFKKAMYVIAQYVAKQDSRPIFGYSKNWVYDGFPRDYVYLRENSKDYSVTLRYNKKNKDGSVYPIDYHPFIYEWYKRYLVELLSDRFLGWCIRPYYKVNIDRDKIKKKIIKLI